MGKLQGCQEQVSTYLPVGVKSLVQQLARHRGVSMNSLITDLVFEELANSQHEIIEINNSDNEVTNG